MVSLTKVTLEKGDKVSLKKNAQGFGTVRIALNWSRGASAKGFLGSLFGGGGGVDLDLACFVETRDGRKHVIQALGQQFGSLETAPWVLLPGDDRSGDGGEELRVNGDRWDEVRRILVYAFIYEGAPRWSAANGVATIQAAGNADIEVRLDDGRDSMHACAIALLENDGGALRVTKLGDYFPSQVEIDQRYGWGFRWTSGSK